MGSAICIDSRDNVATLIDSVSAGEEIVVTGVCSGLMIKAVSGIKSGHKIALEDIASGERVIKYGAAIGDATQNIAKGEHVHCHNLKGYRGKY